MKVESLADQLLFTTTRIECSDSQGNKSLGTGFFFNYIKNEQNNPFLVTNKHVIKDSEGGELFLFSKKNDNPKLGKSIPLHVPTGFLEAWFGHNNEKVDIAVMPMKIIFDTFKLKFEDVYFLTIPDSIIPSEDKLKEIDSLEEVIFIGYPWGFWDSKNYLPIVRKGITASPINVDFEGEKKFIIDASVYPGSSGSPVFLFNKGMYQKKGGGTTVGSRLLFLGIVSETVGRNSFQDLESIPQSVQSRLGVKTNQLLNLGVVYKSELITETIEQFFESLEKPKTQDS